MEEKDLDFQTIIRKLHVQLSDDEIYKQIQAQLVKDFQRSGINDFNLTSCIPSEWNVEIQNTLQKLQSFELQQLLYIVDIPERILFQTRESEHELFYLSNAILQRELMKVYYQNQFK